MLASLNSDAHRRAQKTQELTRRALSLNRKIEALRKCTFFLEVLSLQLFDPADCEDLPDSEDENVCVGHRENLLLQQAAENKSKCARK